MLKKVTEGLAPEQGEVNAVGVNLTEFTHVEVITNVDDRKLAEFTDKELAYVLLWTFVRTLSARLRETNDKIRAFFALSSFGPR